MCSPHRPTCRRAFLADVEHAVRRAEPDRALGAAISGIVDFAAREPVVFDFLMHETMLCGAEAQTQRDEIVGRVQALVEGAWARAPRGSRSVDVSPRFVLEGAIRLLGLRARRDGGDPMQVRSELMRWVDAYLVAGRAPRWRMPTPEPGLLELPFEHAGGFTVHPALPKGRHRLDSDVARSVQRERITYATAEAIREKGYADVTVAHIVAAAGVSRDAFYAQFHDKDEAFDGAARLVFEHLLATMAGAFFGGSREWADQVWDAGWAFDRFLESEPSLANFLFIATYAPPARIGRVLDFVLAFALFIEGGNRNRPDDSQLPRTITEAIVCSVLEAVNYQIRHERVQRAPRPDPRDHLLGVRPFHGQRGCGRVRPVQARRDAVRRARRLTASGPLVGRRSSDRRLSRSRSSSRWTERLHRSAERSSHRLPRSRTHRCRESQS